MIICADILILLLSQKMRQGKNFMLIHEVKNGNVLIRQSMN